MKTPNETTREFTCALERLSLWGGITNRSTIGNKIGT
jgi:hypothetical protein